MRSISRRFRRLGWAVALATLLAALAAGCGSSSNSSSDTTSSTTASAASGGKAAKGAPLKIGVIDNMTGPDNGEEYPPVVLKAWANATNASGGVAGHPVEFSFADTKGDAATAASAAAGVINDSSIDAIVSFDAYTEAVYAKSITEAGIPVIGGLGYNPESWASAPNWLPVTALLPTVINASVVQAHTLGAKKIAAVVCAEVATCEAVGDIAKEASEALGMQYVGTVKVAAATPDYTAQCLEMIHEGADFIVLTHEASVNLRVAQACQTQGYKGKFGLPAGAIESSALEADAPAGVKLYLAMNAFPWFADEPPAAAYRQMMQSQGVAEKEYGDPHAAAAYSTMELFKKALTNYAGSLPAEPTREDVISAYGTIKDETLGGLLPQPTTFTPGKAEPLINCYWFATFEDGTFTPVSTLTKPTCDPPEIQKLYPN